MRPLSRLAGGYPTPANLGAFKGPEVKRALGSATPATQDCLELLDKVQRGEPFTADQKVAAGKILARLPRHYKQAMPAMIDTLGPYCAYCEMRLDDPIQLEHALPKGPYP